MGNGNSSSVNHTHSICITLRSTGQGLIDNDRRSIDIRLDKVRYSFDPNANFDTPELNVKDGKLTFGTIEVETGTPFDMPYNGTPFKVWAIPVDITINPFLIINMNNIIINQYDGCVALLVTSPNGSFTYFDEVFEADGIEIIPTEVVPAEVEPVFIPLRR